MAGIIRHDWYFDSKLGCNDRLSERIVLLIRATGKMDSSNSIIKDTKPVD